MRMLTIWHMSLSVFSLHSLIGSGRRISTSFDVQTPGIWIWMGPVQNLSKHIEFAKVDLKTQAQHFCWRNKKQCEVYWKHLRLAQGWNSAFSKVFCAFTDTIIQQLFTLKSKRRHTEKLKSFTGKKSCCGNSGIQGILSHFRLFEQKWTQL